MLAIADGPFLEPLSSLVSFLFVSPLNKPFLELSVAFSRSNMFIEVSRAESFSNIPGLAFEVSMDTIFAFVIPWGSFPLCAPKCFAVGLIHRGFPTPTESICSLFL